MKDGRKQSQRMIKFENDALSSPRGYFPSRSSKRGDFARTMIIARELSAQTNISEQADYTQRISVIGYRRSGYFVVFFVQIYAPNKGQKGETTAGAVALAFSFSRSSLSLSLSLSLVLSFFIFRIVLFTEMFFPLSVFIAAFRVRFSLVRFSAHEAHILDPSRLRHDLIS